MSVEESSIVGITEDDMHFHEPIIKNVLDDVMKNMNDHMFRLKVRLEYENRAQIESLTHKYEGIVAEKDNTIQTLQEKIQSLEATVATQNQDNQIKLENAAAVYEASISMKDSRLAFLLWKTQKDEAALHKDLEELAANLLESNEKHNSYVAKVKEVYEKEKEAITAEVRAHSDKITTDMIKKYESEIFYLNREVEKYQQQASHERNLRQQLENELRQMFLKNMTNMNIEAFRIFQQAMAARETFEQEAQNVENLKPLPMPHPYPQRSVKEEQEISPQTMVDETPRFERETRFEVVDVAKVLEEANLKRSNAAFKK